MTDPSIGELSNRVLEATRSIERLAAAMETNYVRKDVHLSELASMQRAVTDLTRTVENSIRAAERSFVPRSEYEPRHSSLWKAVEDVAGDVAEVNRKREKESDRFKQLGFTIAATMIGTVGTAALAVSNLIARGGGLG